MVDFKLYDNGIRAVHKKIGDTKAFSLMICVLAGAEQDPKGQEGIAHYAEHMFFKSTKNRTTKQIIFDLDNIGSKNNASTSREITRFYLTTTIKFIEQSFDILTDCLCNSLYLENEMETEKKVVCSEIEMYDDDKMDTAYRNSVSNFFDEDYSRKHDIIGSKQSVNAITRQNLIDFHKNNYTSGRIIISTAGGVDFEVVDEYIQKYIIPYFKTKEKPVSFKLENKVYAPEICGQTLIRETEQFYFSAIGTGFAKNSEEALLLDLSTRIMGGAMSSRLFQAVREEKGLVYDISAVHLGGKEYGYSVLEFACNYENAEQALVIIKDEINKLKQNGFTKEELELVKTKRNTSLIIDSERSSVMVNLLASELAYSDNLFDIDKEIEKVNAVTVDKLNDFVKNYLQNLRYCATAVANKKQLNFMNLLKD